MNSRNDEKELTDLSDERKDDQGEQERRPMETTTQERTGRGIRIPYRYEPRSYQLPGFLALHTGKKRGVFIWHRRAGKDKTFLNYTIEQMVRRVGVYYHFFPTHVQGRRILWDGIDRAGMRFLDHFPKELLASKPNSAEMKITLRNGSIWQVVGTDKYDSIVGTNPVGCVFSEYSLQNPRAWDFVRPILAENGGWAVFIYTPRGKNHGFDLYQMAKENPAWHCEILTVDDTGAVPPEAIEEERASGMDEDLIKQEFYCSFEGAVQGSYYARQLQEGYEQGRVTRVPIQPDVPVDTWWDLGIDDSTTIWFTQNVGQEIRVVDYYENQGEGLAHYAQVLDEKQRQRRFRYGTHHAPHDIKVRELGTGVSRWETAKRLGITFDVVENHALEDGIDAVRRILPLCWFDDEHCEKGLNALENYRKAWDDINRVFKPRPVHDWASHAADAFRYLAVGNRIGQLRQGLTDIRREDMVTPAYDPLGGF